MLLRASEAIKVSGNVGLLEIMAAIRSKTRGLYGWREGVYSANRRPQSLLWRWFYRNLRPTSTTMKRTLLDQRSLVSLFVQASRKKHLFLFLYVFFFLYSTLLYSYKWIYFTSSNSNSEDNKSNFTEVRRLVPERKRGREASTSSDSENIRPKRRPLLQPWGELCMGCIYPPVYLSLACEIAWEDCFDETAWAARCSWDRIEREREGKNIRYLCVCVCIRCVKVTYFWQICSDQHGLSSSTGRSVVGLIDHSCSYCRSCCFHLVQAWTSLDL